MQAKICYAKLLSEQNVYRYQTNHLRTQKPLLPPNYSGPYVLTYQNCLDYIRYPHYKSCSPLPNYVYAVVGWAYIAVMISTLITFATGMLSIQADKATSKDKIEDEILEGKRLICVI